MTTRLKWLCALALVCSLALTVGACGGGDDEGTDTQSSKPSPSEISGTVTVWDAFYKAFPVYSEAVVPLDEAFKTKYPNVTVEHVAQPYEEYSALLRAAFAGREGPDVMMMLPSMNGVLLFTEGLEELNDRITPEMQEQLKGWYTMTPGYTDDGPHYGVPIALTDFVFYYNKKLFKKAGLPTDFQPKTWEELRDVGVKLKAAGIQPFTGGDKEGYEDTWWWMEAWPTVNTKEEALALGNGELPFTSDAFAEAFEPQLMMKEAGLLEEDRYTTPFFTEGYERFSNGKAGMILGGATAVAFWGEFNEALGEENVGVFLPPGTSYVNAEPEYGWSIPKFSDNKDAAWAYIEFMASKEGQKILFEKGGELPNRKDMELAADAPEQAKQIFEWYTQRDAFTTIAHLVSQEMQLEIGAQAKEFFQGRISMEEMQKNLQETFDKSRNSQ
jgi:ABC-type glycerol-3-phosphate transport system substrate-binding protein